MADIFLGVQLDQQVLERLVVIKKIHRVADGDTDASGMFADEARIVSTLSHPHVVQIFDFTEEENSFHIIMEYIDGENLGYVLNELRKQKQKVPFPIIFRMMDQALEALQYIHTAESRSGEPLNIVHRDLDPRNLMIDSNGYLKIIDFGVAKAVVQTELTAPGLFKGKLSHVAPEIFTQSDIDHRADIYSIGLVLFELVTGDRPYRFGKSAVLAETIKRIVDEPLPRPSDINPNIPQALEDIILKACAKNRDDRYQTAEELHHALSSLAHSGDNAAGVATNAEVKKWFIEHFTDRLAKRRTFENMTLQKAKQLLDGIRPMRPSGILLPTPDGERSGFGTMPGNDCRVTGPDTGSGVSFGTGMAHHPSAMSRIGTGMQATPPPPTGPFNLDDASGTYPGTSRSSFFKVAVGSAAAAIAIFSGILFWWQGHAPWQDQTDGSGAEAVVQKLGSISIATDEDLDDKNVDSKASTDAKNVEVATLENSAATAAEKNDDPLSVPGASKYQGKRRAWLKARAKRKKTDNDEDEYMVESVSDDYEPVETPITPDDEEADPSDEKPSAPKVVAVAPTPPPTPVAVPPTPIMQPLKRPITSTPPVEETPQLMSGTGNWSGSEVAKKGCGSCHALNASSKTASQWEYFFSHNRHRRKANLKKLFSKQELKRVESLLIKTVQKSNEKNSGIAGIR